MQVSFCTTQNFRLFPQWKISQSIKQKKSINNNNYFGSLWQANFQSFL